ncbi:MAG: glyoxalase/bleomycin resistance protein/dioxygenase [Planctomycetaceae bacterium]|nr:glyoxalase/bleomycin resistance protein/dioxygenase [Planctomycetaceae bacterium]
MKVNAYLTFDGKCDAAFQFYEKCLGGKIVFKMTHGDSPMCDQMPPNMKDTIMHARMVIGEGIIMGSDAPPDRYAKPQGFNVALNMSDPAEAERIFQSLSQNGVVMMPLQETFWALKFAMFVDQFGIPWMINCEKPAP